MGLCSIYYACACTHGVWISVRGGREGKLKTTVLQSTEILVTSFVNIIHETKNIVLSGSLGLAYANWYI